MADGPIRVEGARSFQRAMSRAQKELRSQARRINKDIAELVVPDARRLAVSAGGQARAAAPTIRAVGGSLPTIAAGGAKKVTSSGASAGEIYGGGTFGSRRFGQFPLPKRGGRDIFPAIAANRDEIADRWFDLMDELFMHGAGRD